MAEAELRTAVDLRRVADCEHVAGIRHELAPEAEHEPDGMKMPRGPVDSLRAGEVGEAGDRPEREQGRHDEHQDGTPLHPAERPPKEIQARSGRLRHAPTLAGNREFPRIVSTAR